MVITRFNIDKLLRNYQPPQKGVRRSLDTIAGKLIIANKIPADIVGAAVFETFHAMAYSGLEFKDMGYPDSRGDQLFKHIRKRCVEIGQRQAAQQVTQKIMDMCACSVMDCKSRRKDLVQQTRWERLKRFLKRPRGFYQL